MTASVIVPYEVTAAEISATNIALEAEYASGESLTKGDIRRVGDDIYEYAGANGTTHDSPTDEGQTDWVFLGPANRYRPFDIQRGVEQESVIQTQAENADTITYTLTGLGRIMGMSFENVSAISIRVKITAPTSEVVYDQTYALRDLANYGTSWWDYLNLPLVPERQYRITNLNAPPNSTVEITLDNTGETAKVGAIVLGLVQTLGAALLEPSWAISSYSIRQFDGFKRTLVRLNPGESLSCDIKIPSGSEAALKNVLKDLDGIAAVWIISPDHQQFSTYGVLESVTETARARQHSFLQLRVEGL